MNAKFRILSASIIFSPGIQATICLLCLASGSSALAQADRDDGRLILELGLGRSDLAGAPVLPVLVAVPSVQPSFPTFPGLGVGYPAGGVVASFSPVRVPDYDDDQSATRIAASYAFFGGLAVELGYAESGDYRTRFAFLSCAQVLQCSTVEPTLSMDQWTLGLRYDHRLTRRLSGTWRIGYVRSEFDVDTAVTPLPGLLFYGLRPIVLSGFEAPDDETGLQIGTGLRWRFAERFDLGLNYFRQDVRFGTADVIDLSFGVKFLRRR